MKSKKARVISFLLVLLLTLSMAACGQKTPSTSSSSSSSVSSSASSSDSQSLTEDLAFQKYDTPLTVSVIRTVDDTTKFMDGEDINNNAWAKLYKDTLNLTLKYDWTASTSQQYDDKLNVSIASGMLPDVFQVNRTQLARLAKTDLINKDLMDAYNKYASPLLKEIMTQEGTTSLDSATFGGKLAALPNTGSSMDGAPMMWIRQDWLDKLGMTAPKTIDDLVKLIDAFTTQDPNGSGAKDYVGLAMTKDLYAGGFADLTGFFNAYHAYPQIWVKDSSGKLVYGSYQPQMKDALKKLQELYKAGKIDKEFAVKDGGKESELCSSGKNGIEFGQDWNPLWPLQSNKDNDPKADWVAYPLPSVDGSAVNPQVSLGTTTYFVCNKNFKNPEAVVKMQNLFVQKGWGGTVEDYTTYFDNTVNGTLYETFKYSFAQAWPARKNLDIYLAINDALKTNDTSKLNPEQLTNYNTVKSFMNGDNKGFGMARVFGDKGSFSVTNQYVSGNMLLMNAFYGADTPTMITKKSALDKLEIETFTKIIMGDSIDKFDSFVKTAMSLGGTQIQQEVNDWYASTSK